MADEINRLDRKRNPRMSRRTILSGSLAGAAAITAAGAPFGKILAQDGSPAATPEPADPTQVPAGSPVASPIPDASPSAGPGQFAYVGSDSRSAIAAGADPNAVGISVFTVDPSTGVLTHVQTVPSDNAFFFDFHPSGNLLYAVNVIGDYEGGTTGSVEAYQRDPATGMLTFINRVPSGGGTAAQPAVDPSGRWLIVANYGGENITVLPINEDGSLGDVVTGLSLEGSGPHERQDKSYPHAVVFDPSGNFIGVADLGGDQVLILALDGETGELSIVSEASSAPGAGPRHVAFNDAGTLMYVVNELNATIDVWEYDSATGTLGASIQTISTVPEPFEGTKSTAEIMIHPSGLFLYNSNRGQPDSTTPEGDAIVAYSIDQATGMLSLIGHTTEEIEVPWSFAFDASGTFLYAANYGDSSITQFTIDQTTGELTFTGNRTEVDIPFVIQMSPV